MEGLVLQFPYNAISIMIFVVVHYNTIPIIMSDSLQYYLHLTFHYIYYNVLGVMTSIMLLCNFIPLRLPICYNVISIMISLILLSLVMIYFLL